MIVFFYKFIGFFYKWCSSRGFQCNATCIYCSRKLWGPWGRQWDEGGFLDISKAFDRVWHRGLIARLRSIGVEGNLLNWFISYLSCRKQRVIIKEVHSDWRNIEAGVPQGSVSGPLFLIYINDPPATISSRCFLFADDWFLQEKVQSPCDCASKLNHDLTSISDSAKRWLVTINETQTKSIVFSAKTDKPIAPLFDFEQYCYWGCDSSWTSWFDLVF